jgi:hypothetical protein
MLDMLQQAPAGAAFAAYFPSTAAEPLAPQQSLEAEQQQQQQLQQQQQQQQWQPAAAPATAPEAPPPQPPPPQQQQQQPSAAAQASGRALGGAKKGDRASGAAITAAAAESNVELTNTGRPARRSAKTSNYAAALAQVRPCRVACPGRPARSKSSRARPASVIAASSGDD